MKRLISIIIILLGIGSACTSDKKLEFDSVDERDAFSRSAALCQEDGETRDECVEFTTCTWPIARVIVRSGYREWLDVGSYEVRNRSYQEQALHDEWFEEWLYANPYYLDLALECLDKSDKRKELEERTKQNN